MTEGIGDQKFICSPRDCKIRPQINSKSHHHKQFSFCLVSGVSVILPQRRAFDVRLENIQILGKSPAKVED